jgi:hypothetical protein
MLCHPPMKNEANTERSELGRYLIDVILHEDTLCQKWIEFLIAVEAALVVALGFLLRSTTESTAIQKVTSPVVQGGVYMIPLIGILAAWILTRLALLSQRWIGWYVSRFDALPDFEEKVFPKGRGKPGFPDIRGSLDSYGGTIRWLGWIIEAGWMVVLILLLIPLVKAAVLATFAHVG